MNTNLKRDFQICISVPLRTAFLLEHLLWLLLDVGKHHSVKSVQIRRFFGPFFPLFALNIEIYSVNFCIQSEYRKMWTRKNLKFGHFSRSALVVAFLEKYQFSGKLFLDWKFFKFLKSLFYNKFQIYFPGRAEKLP